MTTGSAAAILTRAATSASSAGASCPRRWSRRSRSSSARTSRRATTPAFVAELDRLLTHYVGRPTPLYEARRLTAAGRRRAHLPEARGPRRTPARTRSTTRSARRCSPCAWASGASSPRPAPGSTASRRATACALLGLECVVYMGAEDMARQALNVFRMRLLGAEVLRRRRRQPHAEGRHQRGDARLGHQRRATPTTCSARCSGRIRIR